MSAPGRAPRPASPRAAGAGGEPTARRALAGGAEALGRNSPSREAGPGAAAARHRPTTLMDPLRHVPVLLQEAVSLLARDPDGLYLDATVGLGGHAEALLQRAGPAARLLGTDMDPEALEAAARRLEPFGGRVRLERENFRNLGALLERERFFPLSGALFDLGVSSLQLERGSRGFSFQEEGPLDMRLDPSSPLTAARIVNEWPVEQLELLLKEFGEEPEARRVARWIVEARAARPFETTTDLGRLISARRPGRPGGVHPATRTFLALRIAVNRELENLTRGLESVLPFLKSGGRLAVISFHSLEDRLAKHVLKSFEDLGACRALTPTPVRPSPQEAADNPRARSAKLRVAEKC